MKDEKIKDVISIIKNADLKNKLMEINNEYLVSYVNMRKYPRILFIMVKIMEMNNS